MGWGAKINTIDERRMDQTIFVGPSAKNHVGFVKIREIKDYLNDKFIDLYNIWSIFHVGLGLPYDRHWRKHPLVVVEYIETLELLERQRLAR